MSQITKEVIKERLDLLQQQRADAQAQVYGFDGAIQDARFFLQFVEQEVDEEGKGKPSEHPGAKKKKKGKRK